MDTGGREYNFTADWPYGSWTKPPTTDPPTVDPGVWTFFKHDALALPRISSPDTDDMKCGIRPSEALWPKGKLAVKGGNAQR